MAKCIKQAPDWTLANEFDGIGDDQRIRANAPQYRFKAKTIPLSTFGEESPLLASNEHNPEAMLIAREEIQPEELEP